MKIHSVQLDIVWEDKPANHARVRQMLNDARPQPGSLVLLPEMFSTGFSMNVTKNRDNETREDQQFLANAAREFGIYLLGGITISASDGKGLNQAVLYAPDGAEISRYTKLQPYTGGKEFEHFLPGNALAQFTWNDLRVSPFICYDLRFPEHFRRAARQGAEMFLVIANWPARRVDHWIALLRARAIENQAYVAAVNRCGKDPYLEYPGRSLIVDPQGNVIADAGDGERVIDAEIDVEALRSWRKDFRALADMRKDLV